MFAHHHTGRRCAACVALSPSRVAWAKWRAAWLIADEADAAGGAHNIVRQPRRFIPFLFGAGFGQALGELLGIGRHSIAGSRSGSSAQPIFPGWRKPPRRSRRTPRYRPHVLPAAPADIESSARKRSSPVTGQRSTQSVAEGTRSPRSSTAMMGALTPGDGSQEIGFVRARDDGVEILLAGAGGRFGGDWWRSPRGCRTAPGIGDRRRDIGRRDRNQDRQAVRRHRGHFGGGAVLSRRAGLAGDGQA